MFPGVSDLSVSDGEIPTSVRLTLLLVASAAVTGGAIISPALPAVHVHFGADSRADVLTRLVLTLLGPAITLSALASG
jgi:hypothetical protein